MTTTTTALMWIKSYQNHVIYCSVYLAVAITCLKSAQQQQMIESFSNGHYGDIYHPMNVLKQVIAACAALLFLAEMNYVYKRSTLPPGDSGIPILGDLLKLIGSGPRELFLERHRTYGRLSTHNVLMTPTMIVSHDDDINKWITHERKGDAVAGILPHHRALIGEESIMMQSAKQHRRLRRMFEPSFSPTAVKGYVEIIDKIAKEHLEQWASKDNLKTSKEWSFLAMRLFFACAFGEGEVNDELLNTLNRLFLTWAQGMGGIIPYSIPGTLLHQAHEAKKELEKVLLDMVQRFKDKNPPNSPNLENSMMGRLCYGVDDDGQPLAESQLIANILFILFAGHDTTKGSFCAFVHYLKKYPDVRNMLVEEVQTFSDTLNVDELKEAPLLNAFLAETWRLAAPLGDHILKATKDIDFNGYKVRKGVQIALSLQGYNLLDASNGNTGGGRYQDPLEFRMERWLPKGHPMYDEKYFQEGVNYNVMSAKYRAFNMGAHSCLGAHFAKLEARIVLTRLLQSYDIEVRNEKLRKFPLLQHENEFLLTKRDK